MSQEGNNYSEFEIKVRDISVRVRGSEAFVKENLEKFNDIIATLISISSSLPPIRKQSHAGSSEEESDEPESPPLPSTPPDGISESDWRWIIAGKAEVAFETINTTFTESGNSIIVDDWDLEGDFDERLREIALITMYSNHVLSNTTDFTTKSITKSFRHLGMEYDHRTVAETLSTHAGIRAPKSGWLKFNVQGRKAATDLLKQRQKELER